jgi:hypothetical protein
MRSWRTEYERENAKSEKEDAKKKEKMKASMHTGGSSDFRILSV